MKEIILISDQTKRYCKTMIDEMKIDGTETVIFKKTDKTPTAKQRRLQWMWAGEVASSGLGMDDDKNDVHTRAKWMFLRPILKRDDDVFPIIYRSFIQAIKDHDEDIKIIYRKKFTEQYMSTELITRHQRAEYLTEFQKYWIKKGANLSDPALQGIDLNKV